MPRKQSTPAASSIASRVLRNPSFASEDDITALAASVLGQDERKGQEPMTMQEVEAMFPGAKVENYFVGHGMSALSVMWEDPNPKKPDEPLMRRQSMLIGKGDDALGNAATLLRQAVDALSEA